MMDEKCQDAPMQDSSNTGNPVYDEVMKNEGEEATVKEMEQPEKSSNQPDLLNKMKSKDASPQEMGSASNPAVVAEVMENEKEKTPTVEVEEPVKTSGRPELTDEMKLAIVKGMHSQPASAAVKLEFVDFSKVNINNPYLKKCQAASNYEKESYQRHEANKPPSKKAKKNRGRNKDRPRDERPNPRDSICQYIATDKPCPFAEKCQYTHDIKMYLANKPKDIKEICYNFETFGKCPFGLSCRFSSHHTSEECTNIIDEDKVKETSGSRTKTILTPELKNKLRKKIYNFPKANAFLKALDLKRLDIKRNYETYADGRKSGIGPIHVVQEATQDVSESSQPVNAPDNMAGIFDEGVTPLPTIKKTVNFKDKLYLAPLTTVGNLPFRRVCKRFGADITCGEMAMCTNLLQGHPSEWALLKRHACEDVFGVQICGSFPDTMTKCTELINNQVDVDFIDINVGCPIDLVFKKGAGSALMNRMTKFEEIVRGMVNVSDVPITVKMRAGVEGRHFTAHKIVPKVLDWGASLVTIHGRTREQRYTRAADWEYLEQCASLCGTHPFLGNGDVFSFEDVNRHKERSGISSVMVARGALIKPWIFTEIKEQRHWDISSSERFSILQDFTNFGLEHWGSDQQGVDKTRRFMLEWLSFLYRYIPVGVLERVPQRINERPPHYIGRNDLETLMASPDCRDWVKISEMLLGPVADSFQFLPKHKANSYST